MKNLMFLLSILFVQNAFALNIECGPWGYYSEGKNLMQLNLYIDNNGNYEAQEDWGSLGIQTHSGKASITTANLGWVYVELLQEDSQFPHTRGFIKIQLQPQEAFLTNYKAFFPAANTPNLWESKTIVCTEL